MVLNSDIQIFAKIKKARRGTLFFTNDFASRKFITALGKGL